MDNNTLFLRVTKSIHHSSTVIDKRKREVIQTHQHYTCVGIKQKKYHFDRFFFSLSHTMMRIVVQRTHVN